MLLVDDSPYNLLVLKELLNCTKLVGQVQTAMTGYDAIQKVMENSNLMGIRSIFDIIFMDLHMPILGGFEVKKFTD